MTAATTAVSNTGEGEEKKSGERGMIETGSWACLEVLGLEVNDLAQLLGHGRLGNLLGGSGSSSRRS
jgi:hypothetical protein